MRPCTLPFILALMFLCLSVPAQAGDMRYGATSTCVDNRFDIGSRSHISSLHVLMRPGTTVVKPSQTLLRCTLGRSTVEMDIRFGPPAGENDCDGSRLVYIDALRIDGKDYLEQRGNMVDSCSRTGGYSYISVTKGGNAFSITTCRGHWDWLHRYVYKGCGMTQVLDAAGAAEAQETIRQIHDAFPDGALTRPAVERFLHSPMALGLWPDGDAAMSAAASSVPNLQIPVYRPRYPSLDFREGLSARDAFRFADWIGWQMSSGWLEREYGRTHPVPPQHWNLLHLGFDTRQVCITKPMMERAFGKPNGGPPGGVPMWGKAVAVPFEMLYAHDSSHVAAYFRYDCIAEFGRCYADVDSVCASDIVFWSATDAGSSDAKH